MARHQCSCAMVCVPLWPMRVPLLGTCLHQCRKLRDSCRQWCCRVFSEPTSLDADVPELCRPDATPKDSIRLSLPTINYLYTKTPILAQASTSWWRPIVNVIIYPHLHPHWKRQWWYKPQNLTATSLVSRFRLLVIICAGLGTMFATPSRLLVSGACTMIAVWHVWPPGRRPCPSRWVGRVKLRHHGSCLDNNKQHNQHFVQISFCFRGNNYPNF